MTPIHRFFESRRADRLAYDATALFSPGAVADFDTVGRATGPGAIARLLEPVQPGLDVTVTTVTNLITVPTPRGAVVYALGHHLEAYDRSAQLTAFLHGGRYRFTLDGAGSRISEIRFDLDYEGGNTAWTRGRWRLRGRGPARRSIESTPLLEAQGLGVVETVHRFCWALDTQDLDLLNASGTDGVDLSIDVDGIGRLRSTGIGTAEAFLRRIHAAYDQLQHSLVVRAVDRPAPGHAIVSAGRLNPARTGNKHLSTQTKYDRFFDADVRAHLVEGADGWRVTRFTSAHREMPERFGVALLVV